MANDQIELVVDFDADGYDLTHDEITVGVYRPFEIVDGHLAHYMVFIHDYEDFIDDLEDLAWCYNGVKEI